MKNFDLHGWTDFIIATIFVFAVVTLVLIFIFVVPWVVGIIETLVDKI